MVAAEGVARLLHGSEAGELNRRLRARYIRPEALEALGEHDSPPEVVVAGETYVLVSNRKE